MARHFDLTDADISEMASAFGMEATSWEFIEGGDANTSCLLTDEKGTRYALTVLRGDTQMSPEYLAGLLEMVAERGIPVCPPLKTLDGSHHTSWQGRDVILKPFAEGQCGMRPPLSVLEEAGAILARIHLVPPPQGMPVGTHAFDHSRLEDIVGHAPPEHVDWLRASLDSTDHVEGSPVPHGLVHGDFWADNLVLTPQGLVIIDWEHAALGSFVFDIAWGLPGLVLREDDSLDPVRLRSFLKGYESVRGLSTEEKALLGDALLRTSAIISCGRFRKHHVMLPDPSLHDPKKYGRYMETVQAGKVARTLSFDWRELPATS